MRSACLMRTAAVALGAGLAATPAAAQDQEKPPMAAYREQLMEGLQAHNGALRGLASGDLGMSGHVLGHAEAINKIAIMLADVFPAGSGDGTRAKPEIWQNWSEFESKRMDLVNTSAALVEAARGGNADAIGEAARAMGQTCRGCHTDYRAPAN